jgi:hypothetical protein
MVATKRFEEDDFSDDSIVLQTGPGGAMMLPKSAARLDPDQREVLADLQRTGHELRDVEQRADDLAREAREVGVSWSLIGFCLGITGEAARLRYADRG